MSTHKSKAKCPKCSSTNLHLTEICEASTTFIQSVGYVYKDSTNNEFGRIVRLVGECDNCHHTWIFRKAIQITDILKYPNQFN